MEGRVSPFLFLRPGWLLLLPLVPLLLFLARRRGAGRETPWRRVVDAELLDTLLVHPGAAGGRDRRRALLWGAAWILAILVLAGPSWQRLPPLEFRPAAAPLALLVELSGEVEGERLEETRTALAALLEKMPARPVSLWVYGARAWRVMPASEDRRLLQRLVAALSPSLLPKGGRALAAALEQVAASQARRGAPGEILVVAHGAADAAVERAAGLAGSGFRVHLLDLGESPVVLRRLAEAGKGGYYGAGEIVDLAAALEPRRYRVAEAAGEPLPVDNGPWLLPLLLGLVFLLFRRGVAPLCLLALALPPPPAEAGWLDLFLTPDQQAWRALQQGSPGAAARRFKDPLWRGIALYRAGEYEAAVLAFAETDTAMAHYNRGNALVRLGDLGSARAAYLAALERDPGLVDAKYNLQLVERSLAERSTGDAGRRAPRRPPGEETGDSRHAQELLEPTRGIEPPPPETGNEPEALRASLGGGMLEARDTGSRDPGEESGQTGQAPEQGADRDGRDDTAARRGQARATVPEAAGGARLPGLPRPGTQTPADTPQVEGGPDAGERRDEGPGEGIEGEAGSPGPGSPGETAVRPGGTRAEALRAAEVWLESIRDDPAELLRAIFRGQREEGMP